MKKLALFFFFLMGCTPAAAGVPCALPFNLQNGQPADATQVMANYNALVSCLGNAAAAGNNSDIFQLSGLTTPISPALGGTQTYVATAASTGSGNAQVVSTTVPTGFVLSRGYSVVFVAGFTNTGATTLQVAGGTATNIFRRTSDGPLPLVGGEIVQNTVTVATYDGTQFQLAGAVNQVPIGTVLDTLSSTADLGFVLMLGQCLSNSGAFNPLWAKLGSPPSGGCPGGQFSLPDGRGRVIAQIDSGGSGRITVAGGNFDGTLLGAAGGAQNHTLSIAEVPNLSVSVSGTPTGTISPASVVTNTAGGTVAGTGSFGINNTATSFTGSSFTSTGATTNGGSGSHTVLQPTLMLNRQIKY